jgi:hypothetical protein
MRKVASNEEYSVIKEIYVGVFFFSSEWGELINKAIPKQATGSHCFSGKGTSYL